MVEEDDIKAALQRWYAQASYALPGRRVAELLDEALNSIRAQAPTARPRPGGAAATRRGRPPKEAGAVPSIRRGRPRKATAIQPATDQADAPSDAVQAAE